MNGFLVVKKPKGVTSHDVCEKVRRKFHVKAGHLGTLDPLAQGVLPLAIGKATKLTSFFLKKDKEYEGEMILGFSTDTYDTNGKIIKKTDRIKVSREDLEEVIKGFKGEIMQIPPIYSAIKIGGKRLYSLARKGIDVERKPRKVEIFSLKIVSFSSPFVKFYVHCSSGTYIRSLVKDIGEKLGCFATLNELNRLRNGPFQIKDSISLDKILASSSILPLLKPVETFLKDFKEVKISPEFEPNVIHGTPIYKYTLLSYSSSVKREEMVKVLDEKGSLLCIAESKFNGDEIQKKADNNIIFQPRIVLRS